MSSSDERSKQCPNGLGAWWGLCILALGAGACDRLPASGKGERESISAVGFRADVDLANASESEVLAIVEDQQTSSERLIEVAQSEHGLSHAVTEALVNHRNGNEQLYEVVADGLHRDDVRLYVDEPCATPPGGRRFLIAAWTSPRDGKRYFVDSQHNLRPADGGIDTRPRWKKVLDYIGVAGLWAGAVAPGEIPVDDAGDLVEGGEELIIEGEELLEEGVEQVERAWGVEDGPAEDLGDDLDPEAAGGEPGSPTYGDHDAQALAADRHSASVVAQTPLQRYGPNRGDSPFFRMVNRQDLSAEVIEFEGEHIAVETNADGGYHWRSRYRADGDGSYEFEINVMKRAVANDNTSNPGNRFGATSKVSTRDVFTVDVVDGMVEAADANGDGADFEVEQYFPRTIKHSTVNNEPTAQLLRDFEDAGLDITGELHIGPESGGQGQQLFEAMLDESGSNVRVTNGLVHHLNAILGTRFEIGEVVLQGFNAQGIEGRLEILLRLAGD